MIKETITYPGFPGFAGEPPATYTDDFYFNLTTAEVIDLELGATDKQNQGFSDLIDAIIRANSGAQLRDLFHEVLKKSYGVRSGDGKFFRKTEEAWQDFVSSNAYSQLITRLATDAQFAQDFVNGLLPEESQKRIKEQNAVPGFRASGGRDPNVRPRPPVAGDQPSAPEGEPLAAAPVDAGVGLGPDTVGSGEVQGTLPPPVSASGHVGRVDARTDGTHYTDVELRELSPEAFTEARQNGFRKPEPDSDPERPSYPTQ